MAGARLSTIGSYARCPRAAKSAPSSSWRSSASPCCSSSSDVVGLRFLGQSNARVEKPRHPPATVVDLPDPADPGRHAAAAARPSRRWRPGTRNAHRRDQPLSGGGAGRSSTTRSALPSPSSDPRRARRPTASFPRPPTSACSTRSGGDYHRFDTRSDESPGSTAAAPSTGKCHPRRCCRQSPPTTTSTQVTNDLAERTSNQTAALIAANRSAYTSSRNLFIGVGSRQRGPGGRARPAPLLVADRADPAHGGAARRDLARATSPAESTSPTATSSARSARTSTG